MRAMSKIRKAAERKARRKAKAKRIGSKAHAKAELNAMVKKLQAELNRAIRSRDGAKCFSCGAAPLDPSNWNAGHLFAVKPYPSVRFHPMNIHSQCVSCNHGKSGNHAAYSARFVERYGGATFRDLYVLARTVRQWRADELQQLRECLPSMHAYALKYAELHPFVEEVAA